MGRLTDKLTYANVVSTLCLFLLLGGGAAYAASHLGKNSVGTKQLKNNSVTGAKIKNGAVTGAKVKVSSLGTVPSATNATNATNATSATNAQHAQTADAIQAPEALHLVGEPEAPFAPTWENLTFEGAPAAAFYKDREGVVHLQGIVGGDGSKEVVFTLPAAFRPALTQAFPALGNGGVLALVNVGSSGEVLSSDKDLVNLNGITFRAGQ